MQLLQASSLENSWKLNAPQQEKIIRLIRELISNSVSHSKVIKQNMIDHQKFSFLSFLEHNQPLLSQLNCIDKRALMNHCSKLFPNQPHIYQAIHAQLNPKEHQSILMVTLSTAFNYVPLVCRCVMSPITQCKAPQKELSQNIHKDITRVYNASAKALHGTVNFISGITRCFYELIVNETAARAEGTMNGKHHHIASSSYQLLKQLDSHAISARAHLSIHLNHQKKTCTHACSSAFFNDKKAHSYLKTNASLAKTQKNENTPALTPLPF